jgi:hypothetical protein
MDDPTHDVACYFKKLERATENDQDNCQANNPRDSCTYLAYRNVDRLKHLFDRLVPEHIPTTSPKDIVGTMVSRVQDQRNDQYAANEKQDKKHRYPLATSVKT